MRTRLVSAAVATAALLVLAPSAGAVKVEEVVESGEVIATLSYDKRKDGTFRDFRVKIVRAGETLINEGLPDGCRKCFALPARQGAGEKSILIRDLDADGEPEILADLYSGGAHCCTITNLYEYAQSVGDYDRIRRNWADAGYFLRDLDKDGIREFKSRDANFAYAFSSYAESFLPVQIFRYSDPGLTRRKASLRDVTRTYRGLVRKDAKRAMRLYKRYRESPNVNPRGFLAGWVANKYRLRQRRAAHRFLRRALRRGDLDARSEFEVGKSGRPYVRQLKRFLRKLHY